MSRSRGEGGRVTGRPGLEDVADAQGPAGEPSGGAATDEEGVALYGEEGAARHRQRAAGGRDEIETGACRCRGEREIGSPGDDDRAVHDERAADHVRAAEQVELWQVPANRAGRPIERDAAGVRNDRRHDRRVDAPGGEQEEVPDRHCRARVDRQTARLNVAWQHGIVRQPCRHQHRVRRERHGPGHPVRRVQDARAHASGPNGVRD